MRGREIYQQVGEEDGHEDEEDDPQEVRHGREGDAVTHLLLLTPSRLEPEDAVNLKLSGRHCHGLDEGESRRGEWRALWGEEQYKEEGRLRKRVG